MNITAKNDALIALNTYAAYCQDQVENTTTGISAGYFDRLKAIKAAIEALNSDQPLNKDNIAAIEIAAGSLFSQTWKDHAELYDYLYM